MSREEVAEALKGVRLMVATPCYGGQATAEYLQSMVGFARLAAEVNLAWQLMTLAGESLVTRARNTCVTEMLAEDATHILFLDADIGFHPMVPFKMLMHDEPVVVASYPLKAVNWQGIVDRAPATVEEAQSAATMHVVQGHGEDEGPLREIALAGTGCMLIRREVIDQMIAAHPEWAYTYDQRDGQGPRQHWAIFDCEIEDGRYLSEDYAFCRRWQRMGGRIMLDTEVALSHTGTFTFGWG